jgi:2-methylisocitrate lyase-like PEP mutase family enzyme
VITTRKYGDQFRSEMHNSEVLSVIGVYDVFSATLAAEFCRSIFISGYGFAASHYGLPDVGFNAWPDIVNFVHRVRMVLPETCVLVDMDDGFCDVEVACHVAASLESVGASGVILEDQARPRRCGHVGGKQIMPLDGYLEKLQRVLQTRKDLFVVARTDATEPDEILRRVLALSDTDADAILVDGISDLSLLAEIRRTTDKPLAFNQIVGGATSELGTRDLTRAGISLAIYSTPCLFAAQQAVSDAVRKLVACGGRLNEVDGVTLRECNEKLESNLRRRDSTSGVSTTLSSQNGRFPIRPR